MLVMHIINCDPEMSTCQISDDAMISNNSCYCVVTALVKKGPVELNKYKNNLRNRHCLYPLTSKGIHEKAFLTYRLIGCKLQHFEGLRAKIEALKEEFGSLGGPAPLSKFKK